MTHSSEDPGLFDLPLAQTPPPEEPEESERPGQGRRARRRAAPAPPAESLPLFGEEEPGAREAAAAPADRAPSPRPQPRAVPEPPTLPASEAGPEAAPLAARARAAAGDLVVLGAVGAVAALGARWLGAPVGVAELAPLALFLLAWSFLYFVISLAFWGQTPGMAWAGLVARTVAGEPLSFGQTALRWLGSWLTWATLGVAGLLALSGRSLADRMSGSSTYALPEPAA